MSATWLEALTGGSDLEVSFELYHENSKLDRHRHRHARPDVPRCALPARAAYVGYPRIELGEAGPADAPAPRAHQTLRPHGLSREALSTLLSRAAGRDCPEACAIYFHAATVKDLVPGLYHYDALRHAGVLLGGSDPAAAIARGLLRPAVFNHASALFFVACAFDRLTAPHGERGYRLGLIEAGRLVERLVHAAASLGLAAIETGDFYDREFDVLLGLDGVTAGTLALVAVGSGGEVGRRA